jgi:hypothetical protein
MVEPSIQTDGSACSSIRGMQKYSLGTGGSSIWTLSLDRRSLPNKVIRVLRPSRDELQKWSFPQEHDTGWVKYSRDWPDMLQMVTLLLDMRLGEKEMIEKQALLSKRKIIKEDNHCPPEWPDQ